MKQPEKLYEGSVPVKDLKALAGIAKALNDEITIALDSQAEKPFRFWCKDEQKRAAAVGHIAIAVNNGAVSLRVPAKGIEEAIKAFPPKAVLSLEVSETEDGEGLLLVLTDAETSETRSMTVQEAAKDDVPYDGKVKGGPSCLIDVKALEKVLMTYKPHAVVVEARVQKTRFTVSYKSRRGEQEWHYPTESKIEGGAKFSLKLFVAAAKAAKAVGKTPTLALSSKAMRLSVANETVNCRVYITANHPAI